MMIAESDFEYARYLSMEKSKGLHDGHRDRVRDRFLEDGLNKFRDHEALELMLFYAVPRKDTNELAHHLLNRCNSFSGVLDAPLETLEDCGLSRNAAVFLKLMPEICSRYYQDKYKSENNGAITEENIGEQILHYFIGSDEEQVVLLLLDSKGKPRFCDIISKGTISASEVSVRKILNLAVKYTASGAVIAHNHPSGIALPSHSDVKVTISIQQALKAVGVVLLDHIIVADMDYTCMSQMDEYMAIFLHK